MSLGAVISFEMRTEKVANTGLDLEVEMPHAWVSSSTSSLRIPLVRVSRRCPRPGPCSAPGVRACSALAGRSCPVAAGLQTAFVKSACVAAAVFVQMEGKRKPASVQPTRNQWMSS